MSKRRHRTKVTEKPVFTFRQMERVVDLIDRQARLLSNEKVLPSDDYTYAKNEGKNTNFYYDPSSNTYYFTLKARYPAIENYYFYKKEPYYTDGVIGVYSNLYSIRYRIYLENTNMYAKFNPNDANHAESTITFYNISVDDINNMHKSLYIFDIKSNPNNYYTTNPVDYHRDYRAGEVP